MRFVHRWEMEPPQALATGWAPELQLETPFGGGRSVNAPWVAQARQLGVQTVVLAINPLGHKAHTPTHRPVTPYLV